MTHSVFLRKITILIQNVPKPKTLKLVKTSPWSKKWVKTSPWSKKLAPIDFSNVIILNHKWFFLFHSGLKLRFVQIIIKLMLKTMRNICRCMHLRPNSYFRSVTYRSLKVRSSENIFDYSNELF